jgi:RHS repeat-associated protein
VTTYYVGNHYEVKNSVVTKYYFVGATRLAVRTGGTLSFLLGDHLGSSSVTTDANGAKTASALYKAFGETRYTLGALGTDYKFTGQRLQAELGIYWFQSRWMDPSLGRFTQPDTIVPTSTQGTQAFDRYAYVNNNPVRYNDPTGHQAEGDEDESKDSDELEDIVQDDDDPPPCSEDPTCDPFIDKVYTEGEIQKMIDLLDQYYDDAIGGAILAGVVAGISGILLQGYVTAGAVIVGAELLWEAHNASTLITYLTAAKDIAHEQGGVTITMSHRDNILGGIPVVIEYEGASAYFPITSPGLQSAFDVDH